MYGDVHACGVVIEYLLRMRTCIPYGKTFGKTSLTGNNTATNSSQIMQTIILREATPRKKTYKPD